jgi:hypothetical protein
LTVPGLELQPLGRPARSQSLYRLRQLEKLKNEKAARKEKREFQLLSNAPVCVCRVDLVPALRTVCGNINKLEMVSWKAINCPSKFRYVQVSVQYSEEYSKYTIHNPSSVVFQEFIIAKGFRCKELGR